MPNNRSMDGFDSVFVNTGSPIQEAVAREVHAVGGNDRDVVNVNSQAFRTGSRQVVNRLLEGLKAAPDAANFIAPEMVSLKEWMYALCPDLHDGSSSSEVTEAIVKSAFPTITSAVLANKILPEYTDNLGGAEGLVTDYGDANAEDEIVAGFTPGHGLTRVYDGDRFQQDSIEETYVKIQTAEFGKIIALTWKALRFDRTGQLLTRARSVGRQMGLHRHTFIVEKLQDVAVTATEEAANTSFRDKGTGHVVYSNNHSTESPASTDGQVNDNLGAAVAFDYAAINSLSVLLSAMKDHVGNATPFIPTHIMVPQALHQKAAQLIMSSGQYDTANRATNAIAKAFKSLPIVFPSPIFDQTSTTAYYVGAPKEALIWLWTQRPEVKAATMTDGEALATNQIMIVRAFYGGGCGFGDYKAVAKSAGA